MKICHKKECDYHFENLFFFFLALEPPTLAIVFIIVAWCRCLCGEGGGFIGSVT